MIIRLDISGVSYNSKVIYSEYSKDRQGLAHNKSFISSRLFRFAQNKIFSQNLSGSIDERCTPPKPIKST